MRKILNFLDKIDAFRTLLHIAWSCLVPGLMILICLDTGLDINMQWWAVAGVFSFPAVWAVGIWRMFLTDPDSMKSVIIYNAYFYAIPLVFNVAIMGLMDTIFELDGWDGLGIWVIGIFSAFLCAAGAAAFWIVFAIRRVRRKKGKKLNPKTAKIGRDVMNSLILVALAVFIVIGIFYVIDRIEYEKHMKEVRREKAYIDSVMYDPKFVDAAMEAYLLVNYMQVWGNGEIGELTAEDYIGFKAITITPEIVESGKQAYLDFANQYEYTTPVNNSYPEYIGYADEKTFEIGYQIGYLIPGETYTNTGYVFVKMDEDYNVLGIRYGESKY